MISTIMTSTVIKSYRIDPLICFLVTKRNSFVIIKL